VSFLRSTRSRAVIAARQPNICYTLRSWFTYKPVVQILRRLIGDLGGFGKSNTAKRFNFSMLEDRRLLLWNRAPNPAGRIRAASRAVLGKNPQTSITSTQKAQMEVAANMKQSVRAARNFQRPLLESGPSTSDPTARWRREWVCGGKLSHACMQHAAQFMQDG
jgi:hypothetical protein